MQRTGHTNVHSILSYGQTSLEKQNKTSTMLSSMRPIRQPDMMPNVQYAGPSHTPATTRPMHAPVNTAPNARPTFVSPLITPRVLAQPYSGYRINISNILLSNVSILTLGLFAEVVACISGFFRPGSRFQHLRVT
jgi:hypothetical protein